MSDRAGLTVLSPAAVELLEALRPSGELCVLAAGTRFEGFAELEALGAVVLAPERLSLGLILMKPAGRRLAEAYEEARCRT